MHTSLLVVARLQFLYLSTLLTSAHSIDFVYTLAWEVREIAGQEGEAWGQRGTCRGQVGGQIVGQETKAGTWGSQLFLSQQS